LTLPESPAALPFLARSGFPLFRVGRANGPSEVRQGHEQVLERRAADQDAVDLDRVDTAHCLFLGLARKGRQVATLNDRLLSRGLVHDDDLLVHLLDEQGLRDTHVGLP
jgi:hypothetical protein